MWLPPLKAEGWRRILDEERAKPYFGELERSLQSDASSGSLIFPPRESVFQALEETDLHSTRVVILGQDPYHGPGQALGRSFAVPNELKAKPPSLLNIYREIESDLGVKLNHSVSDLTGWSAQGVLLLNTSLTVRANSPLSHRGLGWEILTDRLIQELANRDEPVVFLLWGQEARRKRTMIPPRHLVLDAVHPSPLSAYRGFFGCRHFSQANAFLANVLRKAPVDWTRISLAC